LLSCNSDSHTYGSEAEIDMADVSKDQAPARVVKDRKLIKTGEVSFETQDLKTSRQQILKAVETSKGYVSGDESNSNYRTTTYKITVRVPSKNFNTLLNSATEGVKEFDSKKIDVKDVTEKYFDTEARLKTQKQLEARYLEVLKKAKTVTEILEVERELGGVRIKIETTEGRLNYLKNQVGLSTLVFNFYKSEEVETLGFGDELLSGFIFGFDSLKSFIIGLISIWPFLIIMGIFIFVLRRFMLK